MYSMLPFSTKHFTLQPLNQNTVAAIAKDGGAAICNSGFIDLGDLILVYDTFLTPQAARDLSTAIEMVTGRKAQIVINSHYHNDHIWGNQVFAGETQIVADIRTRELIASKGQEELDWFSENAAHKLESFRSKYASAGDDERNQLLMWLGYYEGLVEAIPHLVIHLPQISFQDRMAFTGSLHTAELISFTGGHTPCDTVLYLPTQGILFMSDLLFVGYHPYLADGDPFLHLEVLKEINDLKAETFIPGHGPVGTKADLRSLIIYIEMCIETAQGMIDRNVDEKYIDEMQIPEKFLHLRLPDFYHSNLHFIYQLLGSSMQARV